MKVSELFESGAWAEPYYHGDNQRMNDGVSDREYLFVTTDRHDAAQYGRYVYVCSVLMDDVADLTDRKSRAFRAVVSKFTNHEFTEEPDEPATKSISHFLLSHRMWETDKYLEGNIFRYLFSIGYNVIEFRDTDHNENEIFNIVARGSNVNIMNDLNEDLGKPMSLPSAIPINSTPVLPPQV